MGPEYVWMYIQGEGEWMEVSISSEHRGRVEIVTRVQLLLLWSKRTTKILLPTHCKSESVWVEHVDGGRANMDPA